MASKFFETRSPLHVEIVRKTLRKIHKGDLTHHSKLEDQKFKIFKGASSNEYFRLKSCLKSPNEIKSQKNRPRIIWVDPSRVKHQRITNPRELTRDEINLCRTKPEPILKEISNFEESQSRSKKERKFGKENGIENQKRLNQGGTGSKDEKSLKWRLDGVKSHKKSSKKKKKTVQYFYSPDNSLNNKKRMKVESEQKNNSFGKEKFFFKKRNLYYKP